MVRRAKAVATRFVVRRVTIRTRRAPLRAAGVAGRYLVRRVDAEAADGKIRLNQAQSRAADFAAPRVAVRAFGACLRTVRGGQAYLFFVVPAAHVTVTAIGVGLARFDGRAGCRTIVLRGR